MSISSGTATWEKNVNSYIGIYGSQCDCLRVASRVTTNHLLPELLRGSGPAMSIAIRRNMMGSGCLSYTLHRGLLTLSTGSTMVFDITVYLRAVELLADIVFLHPRCLAIGMSWASRSTAGRS